MVVKTIKELKADPRTTEAEIRLKKAGFTNAWWNGLLDRVIALPARHTLITRETITEAAKRRGELAKKMRILAVEIANDLETCEFYPRYGGAKGLQPMLRIGQPHEGALSLAEWVTECAEHLEAGASHDPVTRPLDNRVGVEFEPFVIKGVFYLIDNYLKAGRRLKIVTTTRAKNKETSLLAGALLRKEISPNTVSNYRRKERDKNYKE